jgi:hypothetical protein
MGQKTNAYKGLARTPERKRPLERSWQSGGIMPKWILKNLERRVTILILFRTETKGKLL